MTIILNPLTKRFVKESGSIGKIIVSCRDWQEDDTDIIKQCIRYYNICRSTNNKNWDVHIRKFIGSHNPEKNNEMIKNMLKKVRIEIRNKQNNTLLQRNIENKKKIELTSKKNVNNIIQKYMVDNNQCDCAICINFEKTQEKVIKLKCKHEFHETCIKQWLSVKNVCPMCKKTVK
jgi:hypothetical protein